MTISTQLVNETPNHVAFVGSPNLVILPSGRYVTTIDEWADDPGDWPRLTNVYTSDDSGDTWGYRETLQTYWAKMFYHNGAIYHVGVVLSTGSLAVSKSIDDGETWAGPFVIATGDYHGAPTNYEIKGGRVYISVDTIDPGPYYSKLQVIAGNLSGDLTNASAWSFSNEVVLPGIPSFLRWGNHSGVGVPEIGTLEGNVINIGGQLKVIARLRTGGIPNFAAVYSVSNDATPVVTFESFTPWPGGQNKFHVIRDGNGLFWMASNQATNHLQNKDALNSTGFKGDPSNERRMLDLWYSVDCMNWFHATKIASSPSVLDGYCYPHLTVKGSDLKVMVRVAEGTINQHDSNIIRLYTVENFRSLTDPNLQPLPQQEVTVSDANIISKKLTLPNNTAGKIEFDISQDGHAFGVVSIGGDASSPRGSFRFRVGSAPVFNGIPSIDGLVGVQVNNTVLGGLTGANGAFTIGCATDGAVYFENRTGSSKTVIINGSASSDLI